jgi:hypothetical protein
MYIDFSKTKIQFQLEKSEINMTFIDIFQYLSIIVKKKVFFSYKLRKNNRFHSDY